MVSVARDGVTTEREYGRGGRMSTKSADVRGYARMINTRVRTYTRSRDHAGARLTHALVEAKRDPRARLKSCARVCNGPRTRVAMHLRGVTSGPRTNRATIFARTAERIPRLSSSSGQRERREPGRERRPSRRAGPAWRGAKK